MIAEISGSIGGLKAAYDIAKGLNATLSEVKLAEVRIQLLTALSDARQDLFAEHEAKLLAADRVRTLEAELEKMRDWSAEAERYEPADTGQGALAYREKGTVPGPEDGHWLCPNCFSNLKKSYLIPDMLPAGRVHVLRCHPCGLEIVTNGRRISPPQGGRR